jgi:glycosyltransferase involved in cell wall biosynthesis
VTVTSSAPSVLLLIPAYNEEARIGPVLREFASHARAHYPGRFQIVVVLNGCVDDTLGVVRRVAAEFPEITALDFPGRIGKGGALIEGLKLAPQADLIGYIDADGATKPDAFWDLVRRCGAGVDCVIGSRWLPDSVIPHAQPRFRRFASRVFHTIVQLLFWMNIKDTQCAAKVMRREAVEQIHAALRTADMAFDINLLFALKRAGLRVLEVPTVWTDQSGSKVRIFHASLSMFLSVVRLRLVYSPFYKWLRPLRPIETWIYLKLGVPQARPAPDAHRAPK